MSYHYIYNVVYGMLVSAWAAFVSGPYLALLPIVFHVIEKSLDRLKVVNKRIIYDRIKLDEREKISKILADKLDFDNVSTYFNFETEVHFIFSLFGFALISLLFPIFSCQTYFVKISLATFFFLTFIILLLFLRKVFVGDFVMAAVDPTRKWRNISYLFAFSAVFGEVVTHFVCDR